MTTYIQEVKAYELEEWDEENDRPTGNIEGYQVFSTIKLNQYTFVRAVVRNKTGVGARPSAKVWFAEWKVTFGPSNATQRMTGKMTRAEALKEGERMAALIVPFTFADMHEVEAFYAANRPTVPTYGS